MSISVTHETKELLKTLCTIYRDDLTPKQLNAFDGFRERETLTEKQELWVYAIGEKFKLVVAPAKNVFSELSEKKQVEHKKRAARVQLPWEQPGYTKAAKPPGQT